MRRRTTLSVLVAVAVFMFVVTPATEVTWIMPSHEDYTRAHAIVSVSYDVIGCGILYDYRASSVGFGSIPPQNSTDFVEWLCGSPFGQSTTVRQ